MPWHSVSTATSMDRVSLSDGQAAAATLSTSGIRAGVDGYVALADLHLEPSVRVALAGEVVDTPEVSWPEAGGGVGRCDVAMGVAVGMVWHGMLWSGMV